MVQFDAVSIKNRLIERLKAKTSWADILFYSANNRLIDIFAEELAYDAQYDEMLTREGKWSIAKQISSLLAETQFFNYYPHRKIGSSGDLKISISNTFNAQYALNIDIPKYTIFSNGSISFVASDSFALLNNEMNTLVTIVQGKPKTEIFIAKGDIYETITIVNPSIENTVLDVYVNGTIWRSVNNIREAESGQDQVYEVRNINDFSGIILKFGDDNFGKKLTSGDTVVVKYVETLGSLGNIESANNITTVESIIKDTNGNEVTIYCTNDSPIIGGSDYEDIESIRAKAPKTYQTGDRAISKDDYKSILESFSFIKKGIAWGEAETNADLGNLPGTFIPAEENVVHLSVITTANGQIDSTQEATIRTTLNDKKPPTDIIVFQPVNFIYLNFVVNAYVSNKKYILSYVQNSIASNLFTAYSIDAQDFKKPIRYSDYVSLIDSTEGVDYHETVVKFYKFEQFNNAYTADIKIEMANITPGSVILYYKDITSLSDYQPLAHDVQSLPSDRTGTLVGDGPFTVLTSSINYDTGIGNLIVTVGLTQSYTNYSIKVEYMVDSASILPTKRYQIVSYGTSTITASYV
jgi:hypothetical protein